MKRVAIVASASGSGKTTVGRALAAELGVPFYELDAVNHQAGWRELDAAQLRRRVEPLVQADAWVIDGAYRSKLGDLVLEVDAFLRSASRTRGRAVSETAACRGLGAPNV